MSEGAATVFSMDGDRNIIPREETAVVCHDQLANSHEQLTNGSVSHPPGRPVELDRIRRSLVEVENAVVSLSDVAADVAVDRLSPPDLLDVMDRVERLMGRLSGIERPVIARLSECDTDVFGGGRIGTILADRLRITPAEAMRRIREAEDLADRSALTGERLAPNLPHTAAAERAGEIGYGHIRVIRDFLRSLPSAVPADARETAEGQLAELAQSMRPDELRRCAHRITAHLNPDGHLSERDRAARRYFHLRPQGPDKMFTGSFRIDPELGAYLEAVFAKLAAPGMCHPDHAEPVIDGIPPDDAAASDTRTAGQRRHDALTALCRTALASGKLGSHRGLPVTVIATATVSELRDQAGVATTGGGALLPIRDLIRMAGRANHYLMVFDDHSRRPLYLGRAKRLATPDQRIALHAIDRGCTYPSCPNGGYLCETHHVREWVTGGSTDLDNLTFVCPAHHRLIGPGERRWQTVTEHRSRTVTRPYRPRSRTSWLPPHHVDPSGLPRINRYHHPELHVMHDDSTGPQPP